MPVYAPKEESEKSTMSSIIENLVRGATESYKQYQEMSGRTREDVESIPYVGKGVVSILDLIGQVSELPGADLPFPPLALTRHGLMRGVYKLGAKELPKESRRELAKSVYRLKPEQISNLKAVEELPKEAKGGLLDIILGKQVYGQYDPQTLKVYSRKIKTPSDVSTTFHEIVHHNYVKMIPEDRLRLRDAFNKWLTKERKALAYKLDANIDNVEEAFSEAASKYITRDTRFWEFPAIFRDTVKKYFK